MALENLWQVLKAVAGGWRGVLGVDCVEIAWNEIMSVRFAAIPRRFPCPDFLTTRGRQVTRGLQGLLIEGKKGKLGSFKMSTCSRSHSHTRGSKMFPPSGVSLSFSREGLA